MRPGQIVLITGAAAGIGRQLALRFASAQATVVAADIDAKALDALKDEAGKFGFDVTPERCDVTDKAALTALRDKVLRDRKRIDVWVNNAGIGGLGAFHELDAAMFDRVLAINLHAVVNGTRLALEVMEAQGAGTVVNMASVAGHMPAPFMSAYNTSKFAVVGFSRSLHAELRLRDSPVKLLLVSPGFVETDILARGTRYGFPEWMNFLVARPEKVAQEIFAAVEEGKDEIVPTFNGKLMKSMYRVMPRTTLRSAKMMLAKNWKEALTGRVTLEETPRTKSENDPSS